MEEAMLQIEDGCHQYRTWACSAKGPGKLEACHHLPAVHKAQLLQEPLVIWAVLVLGGAGSQESPACGKWYSMS